MDQIKIKCPACDWEPAALPYWQCHCGHVWNTFETGGRCPQCHFINNYTQCVEHAGGCTQFSLHEDWYHGLEIMVDELVETVKTRV